MFASPLPAEVPMDLGSPFLQTALIQGQAGEIEEKVVRKGKINGEVVELEKEDGGLVVLPRRQLLGILPHLPQPGTAYLKSDAQRALAVLQEAQINFPQRPEVRPEVIAEWKKLSASKTEQDDLQNTALNAWLEKSSRLSSDTAPEELEKMRQEGIPFLEKFPERAKEIERELVGLRELGAIDLQKVDSVPFELGSLGEKWIFGVILWALLILPMGVALKGFSDGLRGFREGLPLAGVVRLTVGGLATGFLVMLLLGGKEGRASPLLLEKAASSTSARRAGWFSLNVREKWSNQAPKKIILPASDWLAFLNEKVQVGAGSDLFPFWHLAKPELFKKDSALMVLQPVQAKVITLPFRFNFHLPKTGQSLTDLELSGASIGKIPLGASLARLIWNSFQPSYRSFAETCGLNQGVRWLAGEGVTVVVEVPQTKKPKPVAKESLSAQELAEVFDQGYGEIYKGRVITVEGALISVSSRRETMGAGTGLAVPDPIDEFVLQGIPEGPGRRFGLQVRCQFKSGDTYSLDTRGDLFQSKNPNLGDANSPSTNQTLSKSRDTLPDLFAGIPVLRRHQGVTLVRMSAGRVESGPDERRVVNLYDCRKVEGYEGGVWKIIWEPEIQPGQ